MAPRVTALPIALLTIVLLTIGVLLFSGCGNQIGDSCARGTDCSTTGDRICDVNSPGGYCTILGCDVGTCPSESVCVRFFPVTDSNRPCDPLTEDRGQNNCTADEVCAFNGTCAPRNSEIRFCMLTCGSGGDCRTDYECRTEALMKEHGGEPVPKPGQATGTNLKNFCAASPR